eukprot:Opistho-2@72750
MRVRDRQRTHAVRTTFTIISTSASMCCLTVLGTLQKKFVLHTNSPGHFDFNRYVKCNFRILRGGEASDEADAAVASEERLVDVPAPSTSSPSRRPPGDRRRPSAESGGSATLNEFVVDPDTKWDDVLVNFGKPIGKPVVFKRGSSSNPFGATFFYGYQQLIFEVMRNNHIASVTIFLDAEGA